MITCSKAAANINTNVIVGLFNEVMVLVCLLFEGKLFIFCLVAYEG